MFNLGTINDGLAKGIKIVEDTNDYTVPQITVQQGINNTIIYSNGLQVHRRIKVELRSKSAKNNFMAHIGDLEGVKFSDGGIYRVQSITPIEVFGTGDTAKNFEKVWTYELELVM